ncbi:MAG: helix-turn-helix transcriptional regulator [Firmicutes bacterium]|nr:helix-turn-helix transcriptional regulator [Bacillota bacterium]
MTLKRLLDEKKMTQYRLAKHSGVPYTTINDIINGASKLEKCSAETVYRLAKSLDITVEELLEPYMHKRVSFELYKSNVCHKLKEDGDIPFLIETFQTDKIRTLYDRNWHPESLYLLAMTDYLCKINDIPVPVEYSDLRKCKLKEPVFPASVLAMALAANDESVKSDAIAHAIPEFLRYNIVESEIRNVI